MWPLHIYRAGENPAHNQHMFGPCCLRGWYTCYEVNEVTVCTCVRVCVLLAWLRLRERRVVLKYLDKLTEKIDACTAEEQTVPEWCTKVGDHVGYSVIHVGAAR